VLLGLLLIGTVAIHSELVEGVERNDAAQILDELRRIVEAEAGQTAVLEMGRPGKCEPRPACVGEILGRTHADEALLVRILGAVTRVGLIVERVGPGIAAPAEAQATLTDDPAAREQSLRQLVRSLYGGTFHRALCAETAPGPPVLSYVGMGLGAAAIIAGAAIWAGSTNSLNDLQTQLALTDPMTGRINGISASEATASIDSINSRRTASAALAAVGTAVLAGSVIWALWPSHPQPERGARTPDTFGALIGW
jgi:hypothetical protein